MLRNRCSAARLPDCQDPLVLSGGSVANKHLEKSGSQDTYEKIRDDITFGRLMSGKRLTEKKLSGPV